MTDADLTALAKKLAAAFADDLNDEACEFRDYRDGWLRVAAAVAKMLEERA